MIHSILELTEAEIRILEKLIGRECGAQLPAAILTCGLNVAKLINKLENQNFLERSDGFKAVSYAKTTELKELLKQNNLKVTGKKEDLINRIKELDDKKVKFAHSYWVPTDKAENLISQYLQYKERAYAEAFDYCQNNFTSTIGIEKSLQLVKEYQQYYIDLPQNYDSPTPPSIKAKNIYKMLQCKELLKGFSIDLLKDLLIRFLFNSFPYQEFCLNAIKTCNGAYDLNKLSAFYITVALFKRLLSINPDYNFIDLQKFLTLDIDTVRKKTSNFFASTPNDHVALDILEYNEWLTEAIQYHQNELECNVLK